MYINKSLLFNLLYKYRYIGLQFDEINKHLQNLASNNKQAIKQAWENTVLDSPAQCTLLKTSSNKQIIWTTMHLHLELCKISREIDTIFGIQTTFKMGCYFGFMAMNLHELFNLIFIKNYFINTKNIRICIQITWFFHNVLKLLFVNYMCEKVSTKANATKTFANRVLCSMCDVEINENISQLLLQMAQSPLRFYGLGLFQFGFKFLHGFTTFLMTAVVILIQAHTNK
ncbi:uncharacterized protein LOC143907247 [Temnothorax americanus]|uniref:uncharacterized protein LOC143907247 n=1 Tax=Temnothorax americanus TaxID=1964332 RepID=UPI00406888E5